MPFSALRAWAFTRATCSMAICIFCLNSSGEFGSTRVDVDEVVSCERLGNDDEAGKLDNGIERENVDDVVDD